MKSSKETTDKPSICGHKQKKVKALSFLQKIFNQRYVDRSLYYFTSGSGYSKDNYRDVTKEKDHFRLPPSSADLSSQQLHRIWRKEERKKELACKYYERPTQRSRLTKDLLKRLYIPPEEKEPPSSTPDILDMDTEFYSLIETAPVTTRFDRRQYLEDVREVLKTRLQVGFLEDEMLLIDEKFHREQEELDKIKDNFKKCCDSFDAFIKRDHEESMAVLSKAQQQAKLKNKKMEEFRELEKQYGFVKTQVYILEEKWGNYKNFQEFLYLMSPVWWRKKHGVPKHAEVSQPHEGPLKERTSSSESVDSLDILIESFQEDIRKAPPPDLYFKSPTDLKAVFLEMEEKNMAALLHSEEVAGPIMSMKQGLEKARKQFEAETQFVRQKIADLEMGINWEEDRAQKLETMAKDLLYGQFKELIVDKNSISLHVYVEDVYEACIAPNDANLGDFEMTKAIEAELETLMLGLDHLPHNIVKKVEREAYEEEARVMREAEEAEAKLKQMEQLKRRLKRAMEPPFVITGKRGKPRSALPPPRKKPPRPETPLTEEQKDFLAFFTEYCHHTDNVKDYLLPKEESPDKSTQ